MVKADISGMSMVLLVGTLFGWSRIWGFTQCISIFDFLQSVSVSL